MKRAIRFAVLLTIALTVSVQAQEKQAQEKQGQDKQGQDKQGQDNPAKDKGYWKAASKNASSITGDVVLSGAKLSINFMAFTVAPIRELKTEEASAAFDPDSSLPGGGNLYRLAVPGATKLLHKNTLCGGEDTTWMATYASGKTLQIAFFSGARPPLLTIDALANSTDLCGTYTYVR